MNCYVIKKNLGVESDNLNYTHCDDTQGEYDVTKTLARDTMQSNA